MTDSRNQTARAYRIGHNGMAALLALSCLLTLLPLQARAEYSYSADGSELTDSTTQLTWRRCVEGMSWSGSTCTGTAATYSHQAALQRASSEATASKAWRMPNVLELSSITQRAVARNPSIDTTAFPGTPSLYFWTSTPFVGDARRAWSIYFSDGQIFREPRTNTYYVRLVR
ncbi:MAG: DUF1566 domain-containing protein [Rhodoferax sp.]|nr:DUF1566 domain-containing protein [Rhodoferax sp.]